MFKITLKMIDERHGNIANTMLPEGRSMEFQTPKVVADYMASLMPDE